MFNLVKSLVKSLFFRPAKKKDDSMAKIREDAEAIELTLLAFGVESKIVEVNRKEDENEYCLDVAVGTNLNKIIKHDKEIAMAVASPTGKVVIQAPIPGRALVGITIPKDPRYFTKQ